MLKSRVHSSLTKSVAQLFSIPVVMLSSGLFSPAVHADTLTIRVTGGTVFANGLQCQNNVQVGVPYTDYKKCEFDFPAGTFVNLTALPSTPVFNFPAYLPNGQTVDGYNCTDYNGNNPSPCGITMNGSQDVWGSFSPSTGYVQLSVSDTGIITTANFLEGGYLRLNGSSIISANTCSATEYGRSCRVAFPINSQVTVSAIANPGYTFSGWTGWEWGGQQCKSATTDTCQVTLSNQWEFIAIPYFSQVSISCNGGSVATYSNETRQAVLPCVEIPIYIDISGRPTQMIGLYSSILEIPFGFSDFQVKTLTFSQVVQATNPSNARFDPDTGILSIPIIDIPTTVPLLVGSGSIPGPTLRCQATLQQSALRAEVLMLTDSQCNLP